MRGAPPPPPPPRGGGEGGKGAAGGAPAPPPPPPRGGGRKRRMGDAVRAVAARHELTAEGCLFAVAAVRDARVIILDALDRRCFSLEPDLAAVRQALLDQVLDHFLLAIDGNAPTGQLAEVDAMLLAGEAQPDAVVRQALPLHAIAHAGRGEEIGRSLFEDARP